MLESLFGPHTARWFNTRKALVLAGIFSAFVLVQASTSWLRGRPYVIYREPISPWRPAAAAFAVALLLGGGADLFRRQLRSRIGYFLLMFLGWSSLPLIGAFILGPRIPDARVAIGYSVGYGLIMAAVLTLFGRSAPRRRDRSL
jgi:hypothetical protein